MDLGNTVIVVEHNEEAMRRPDRLIDVGPGAGIHGGRIVTSGKSEEVIQHADAEQYLSSERQILLFKIRKQADLKKRLRLTNIQIT